MIEFSPTEDMKTHSPPPHSEVAIFIFRVMADCNYNLRRHIWIFKCVADKKKSFKSDQIYRKDKQ